jgi:hypothetical protein
MSFHEHPFLPYGVPQRGTPFRAFSASLFFRCRWSSGRNSLSHTQNDAEAWWEVDLGQLYEIDEIEIWNRTDCCSERLSNFYVLVSENAFPAGPAEAKLTRYAFKALHGDPRARLRVVRAPRSRCPKEVKFSAFPLRDRWIDRALACGAGRPFPDAQIRLDAELARRHILGVGAQMRRGVAALAGELADSYLARHGLSYDGWMAAVANYAPKALARASEMVRDLEKLAAKKREAMQR